MITRLLNLCGLYLGPEADLSVGACDNEAGFWENRHFVRINEDALARLGGGWDLPPTMPETWEFHDEVIRLRNDAAELVRRFSPYEIWGWKDPRNSIMLPFWKSLIPDLKILVCLRNPLEVARSLNKRGYSSYAFGLNLWLTYHQQLLSATLPTERVVTHYDTYFYNPQAELRRVLGLLNMSASSEAIEQACSTISTALRHVWVMNQELRGIRIPVDVLDCYIRMCGEAGAIYQASAAEAESSAKSKGKTGE
jgi:hypothetical protein